MPNKLFTQVILWIFISAFPQEVSARDIKTVEGRSTYVVPRTISLEDAEHIALHRAITDALAAEFGTIIQSEVWTELFSSNDQSSAEAWMNGLNIVKGEWLETVGEPDIKTHLSEEGYVVEVKVKGRAVAIESGDIDLHVSVKQVDGYGVKEGMPFKSGNRLVVDFASPVNGYLAIFLADARSNVLQLLPFAGEYVPSTPVSGGKSYTFFADNSGAVEEEYILYTDSDRERNILYILFSPKLFNKPYAEIADGIRLFKLTDFRKWLIRQRATDSNMQTIIKPLVIIK